jgi:DNA-binding transcriptional ArsR family regulator
MRTTAKRAGQRGKSVEEVVTYALGHPTRIQILLLLNQGIHTAGQIADLIDEPLNNVANHIRELLDAGSIEIADTKRRGNVLQYYYRGVETPYYSDEVIAAMPPQQRQVIYAMVIQTMMAEVMAALWAGTIKGDPRTWLAWDWLHLDAQGRQDLADEQERSWKRSSEIQVESLNRSAVSGEETTSFIVGQLAFRRARPAPKTPDGSRSGERRTPHD